MHGNLHTRLLLYVGKAEGTLAAQWRDRAHRDWFERSRACFSAELYYAKMENVDLIDDVETVLIYVHQPNENSQKLSCSNVNQHLIVENAGATLPMEARIDTRDSGLA
jgi:hypothetical protein